MITAKQFKLDFAQQFREEIRVNQYEVDGRTFAIQCVAGFLPINLTGAAVTFYAKKPDNTILYNACTITDAVTGKIEYTMTGQTCAVAGTLQCWVEIIKDDAALRSFEFSVAVRPSPDESEAIESTSEFTTLEMALATVGAYDGRISNCEDDIDALDGRLTTAEGEIIIAQGSILDIVAQALSGWYPILHAVTYISATSFAVSGDQTGMYKKGRALRWTQNNTVRESNIISSAYSSGTDKTTVTIHAGYKIAVGDCSVLNTVSYPITNVYIGLHAHPAGFAEWFLLGATPTGFSANPVMALRFQVAGKLCRYVVTSTANGTSNSTTFSVPLPITAASISGTNWRSWALVVNNGTPVDGSCTIVSGSSTLSFYADAQSAFVASGNKSGNATIEYEW